MFNTCKDILKHCLTGIDGVTYDPARVYLFGGVVTFLGATVYVVYSTHAFDYQAFGIGFGALLAGGGLCVSMKAKTEPGQ